MTQGFEMFIIQQELRQKGVRRECLGSSQGPCLLGLAAGRAFPAFLYVEGSLATGLLKCLFLHQIHSLCHLVCVRFPVAWEDNRMGVDVGCGLCHGSCRWRELHRAGLIKAFPRPHHKRWQEQTKV
jgi:hypothetical protein